MTFEEAGQRYAVLRQQRDTGALPDANFRRMAAELVAVDGSGASWQINADTGQWTACRDNAWSMPGAAAAVTPPQPVSGPAGHSMSFEEAGQRYAALRQQRDTGALPDANFRQLVAELMVVDGSGASWQIDAGTGQWTAYRDNAWAMSGAAAAVTPLQPAQDRPAAKWRSRGQVFWDVISVAGSTAMSAAWYSYSGMAETKPDSKTCAAMIVLPIALIVLRKPLDRLLRPLAPIRTKIPAMVLAGCGVALPFLVASYLYAAGEKEFPYMYKTYVYSMLLSYVVLRTPSGGSPVAPPRTFAQSGV